MLLSGDKKLSLVLILHIFFGGGNYFDHFDPVSTFAPVVTIWCDLILIMIVTMMMMAPRVL